MLVEEGGFFLGLVVAHHPLLLLTAGGLGGGDGALDAVDDPAVFCWHNRCAPLHHLRGSSFIYGVKRPVLLRRLTSTGHYYQPVLLRAVTSTASVSDQ